MLSASWLQLQASNSLFDAELQQAQAAAREAVAKLQAKEELLAAAKRQAEADAAQAAAALQAKEELLAAAKRQAEADAAQAAAALQAKEELLAAAKRQAEADAAQAAAALQAKEELLAAAKGQADADAAQAAAALQAKEELLAAAKGQAEADAAQAAAALQAKEELLAAAKGQAEADAAQAAAVLQAKEEELAAAKRQAEADAAQAAAALQAKEEELASLQVCNACGLCRPLSMSGCLALTPPPLLLAQGELATARVNAASTKNALQTRLQQVEASTMHHLVSAVAGDLEPMVSASMPNLEEQLARRRRYKDAQQQLVAKYDAVLMKVKVQFVCSTAQPPLLPPPCSPTLHPAVKHNPLTDKCPLSAGTSGQGGPGGCRPGGRGGRTAPQGRCAQGECCTGHRQRKILPQGLAECCRERRWQGRSQGRQAARAC